MLGIKKGFTLVELVMVITVIATLGAIGFVTFSGNVASSRDSVRLSDSSNIDSALSNYKEKYGVYPLPSELFTITNSGEVVAFQGILDNALNLGGFTNIPVDPSTQKYYNYSVSKNRSQYQLAGTLENDGEPKSFVIGDYTSVSKNILPSIILAGAYGVGTNVEISSGIVEGVANRKTFLFNDSSDNLPYTFEGTFEPVVSSVDLPELLSAAEQGGFWQNIDYRNCIEIYDDGKYIGDGEYQIRVNGALTSTTCTLGSLASTEE